MRWRDGRESDNVEDRRGMSIPRGAKIGGLSGLGLVAVVLIGMFLGIDPTVSLAGRTGNTDTFRLCSAKLPSGRKRRPT